jgi:hypothetical protein
MIDLLKLINSYFRVLPVLLAFISISFALLFHSMFWWFAFFGLLFNGVIWYILTHTEKLNKSKYAIRPQSKHCSYIENNKNLNVSGLPSGHCQSTGFFATWMILATLYFRLPTFIAIPAILTNAFAIYFEIYSRTQYYKCHTVLQASAGSVIGIVSALILWILFKSYLPPVY